MSFTIPSDAAIPAEILNQKRDHKRMNMIRKIRLNDPDLLVLDAVWKRQKLIWIVQGQQNVEFGNWLKDQLQKNTELFKDLNLLSEETILRDSRELERLKLLPKAEMAQTTLS